MERIEQIEARLETITLGEEWTNFENYEHGKVVYEYDRLTEETCDVIATCEQVQIAQFIADVPEMMRYLLAENKRYKEALDDVLFECEVPVADVTAIQTICNQALEEKEE